MMIQIISYENEKLARCMNGIAVSHFTKPQSLDEFDVNVVDLRYANLWVHSGNSATTINRIIGEIKGVNTNIRQAHISQLEVHYRNRLDKLQEEGTKKTVKALLIINPLRNTPPKDREPSHKDPILLAERNNSLIIETITLLKVYELFVVGKLESKECKNMFSSEVGLLTEDVLKKYITGMDET